MITGAINADREAVISLMAFRPSFDVLSHEQAQLPSFSRRID